MPKIPTYMASLDYRPPRGDVAAAGAPGKALTMFGETAFEVASDHAERMTKTEGARQQAETEAERASHTAQGLKSLSQTFAAFQTASDPDSVMDRWRDATEAAWQEIFSAIRSPETRAQVESDYKTLANVQGALLRGDSLRRLAAKGRDDLAGNLALYAETAAAARHPLQHDDAVELGLREIANKAAAGFITTEDADRFEQSFYSNIAERQARDAIAFDPEDSLARLNDGAAFGGLAEAARARLTTEASRAVRARTVRRDSEAAAARRDTLIALPGYLDRLRDGGLPDDSRFTRDNVIATLGEEAGAKTWGEIEQAKALGDAMARVKWAIPSEIDRLVVRGDPLIAPENLPDGLGSGDGASRQQLLQQAVARRNRQLHDKPADTMLANPHIAELHGAMVRAMAQSPLPPAIATAMRAGGNTAAPSAADLSQDHRRAAISAYANATLAEQERLGVPEAGRQVLPEALAKEMVTGILGSDPAKADQTLRDLAKDWGEEWPRVLDDLKRAGLSPEHAALAAMDIPVARQTFAEVLAIQTDEPGALRAQTAADADGIDDLVHRHRASPAGRFLSDDRVKLVKLLAYRYARFSEPEEAVRRAIADFTGDIILTAGSAGTSEADDIANAWRGKGASQRDRWRGNVKVLPLRNPVSMYDSDGNPVMSVDRWGNTVQVQAPEGVNFQVFAEIGEKDRNAGDAAIFERLANFVHGGLWDLQRPVTETRNGVPRKTTFDNKFVNAATVAIGIYAAAAGWGLHDILTWMNRYAAVFSDFGDVKFSQTYKSLPERNVLNTTIGYNMQKDGKISKPE